MTALPSSDDFNAASVKQGGYKAHFAEVLDYLDGLLGSTGVPSDARAALLIPGRNKLVGGDFSENPWQRGRNFASISSGDYTADQWRIEFDGTPDIDVDRISTTVGLKANGVAVRYGLRVTANTTTGMSYLRLGQRIPRVDTIEGENAALSFSAVGSAVVSIPSRVVQNFGTGGGPSSDVITPAADELLVLATYSDLETDFSIPTVSGKTLGTNVDDYLEVQLDLSALTAGNSITITVCQFERGSAATAFEAKPADAVLLECQRFFRKSYPIAVAPGTVGSAGAGVHNFSASWIYATGVREAFAPEMYDTPTVTWYSTSDGSSGNVYATGGTTGNQSVNDTIAEAAGSLGFPELSSAVSANTLVYAHWTAEAII